MTLVAFAIEDRSCVRAVLAGALLLAVSAACGDDSAGGQVGDGCSTDDQCKGDRICVDRECVDPGDADDAGQGRGGRSGGSGRGGGEADAGLPTAGRVGGGAGNTVIDDPELERACGLNCEARHAAMCPMNIGSVDQCMAQCLVIDEANQGHCLDEQRDHYACMASGGYTCINGYPQQQATCAAEALALSTCSQMTPCRAFCAAAEGECTPWAGECMSECLDTQAGFEDAICGIYYTQLLNCWGQNLECEGDRPAVGPCGPAVAEVADCVGRRNHACDGFCWVAEQLGCGAADCATTCMTRAEDTSCGHYYRSLVECSYGSRELSLTCESGEPTPSPTACASQLEQYTTCMQTQ